MPIANYVIIPLTMFLLMTTPLALHVEQQRLNTSLHSGDANGALFALYISMLDTTQQVRHQTHLKNNEETDATSLPPSAPKSALYASSRDYEAYKWAHQVFVNAQQPDAIVRWHNSAHPQPLHHANEAILIPDDVRENASMYTQQRLKQAFANASDYNDADTMLHHENDGDDNQDYTALFDVIEQADNFVL